MSDTIISVENLGKKYTIRHNGEKQRYATIRDTFAQSVRRLFLKDQRPDLNGHGANGQIQGSKSDSTEDFWALKDVSFEVKRGEVLGIIGRNGAGKSTLLKVLSRITEPTTGRVHLRGRVASLLEVGTGFHPELTGRENVFLNGSILGMSRVEIRKKFDEIVAFAEVEKFLDTPVKRYSSGMYVRLAFAVAAHLEPEILIVDEVLAVGDVQFQKKCLGKIKNVSQQGGRTVLFVSHNMAAIATLCSRGISMQEGKVVSVGSVESCIEYYLKQIQSSGPSWVRGSSDNGNSPLVFAKVSLAIKGTQPSLTLQIEGETEARRKHKPAFLAVDILDDTGMVIMQAIPTLECLIRSDPQMSRFSVNIELPPLVPGQYFLTLWMGPHNVETYDEVKSVVSFEIAETPTKGRSFPHSRNHGSIVPASSLTLYEN